MPVLCPTGQLLLTECYLYSQVLLHQKEFFYFLNPSFHDQQEGTLQDHVEATVMSVYND